MKKFSCCLFFLTWISLGISQTYTGSNTTVTAIPDADLVTGASMMINMTGIPTSGVSISDIELEMAINHTWVGDLLINIEAPSGESIVIRPDAIGNGDSSDMNSNFPVTFSDSATINALDMGINIAGGEVICQDDSECEFKPNIGTSPDTFADLISAIGANDPNGNWLVTVYDALGGDVGDFFVPNLRIITMTLGLDEKEIDGFNLYPNPVSSIITIESLKIIESIAIFNMLGQEVYNAVPNTLENEINFSQFPSGSYIIKATIGARTSTKRIVKI